MPNPLGYRKLFAMVAPSVNTVVQPEFEALRPAGVTNHMGRINTPNVKIVTEADFVRHVEGMRSGIEAAIDQVMTTRADYLIMALSLECFWDGLDASFRLEEDMQVRAGVGLTMGSTAILKSLETYGNIKRIALITPHRPLGDARVEAYFTEAGYEVTSLKSFNIQVPSEIADITPEQLRDAIIEVNDDSVDAIVQVGTNLAMAETAARAEAWLDKPVIAINTATYWYALRQNGIDDQMPGYGRLMSDY